MRLPVTAVLLALVEIASAPAAEAARNKPTVVTLRLRMGLINEIHLYPPTVPMIEGAGAVLFFTGDWGWTPVLEETASWLANHGRYVVGIDSRSYFNRQLEPPDWARDLKTLRAFVNERAGLPADQPVLIAGFTWGADMVPYMLNRGGAQGFAGALLIGPSEESGCIFRVTLSIKGRSIPSPADEQVHVADEVRKMAPIPTVFMQGAMDTDSRATTLADLARGPHKVVSIPDADRQFRDVREVYFTIVGQALDWLEGPHPPAGEGSAPGPQPAPPGPSR